MWRRVIGPAVAAFVVAVAGLTGTHPAWAESGPDQPVASSTAAGASSPEMAPSPAEATAALASQTCPAGAMCFWEHANGAGHMFILRTQDGTFHNNSCPGCISSKHRGSNGTWGDQMSSYQNLTGVNYCFYFDAGFSGPRFVAAGNDRRLFNLLPVANDEVSSGNRGFCAPG